MRRVVRVRSFHRLTGQVRRSCRWSTRQVRDSPWNYLLSSSKAFHFNNSLLQKEVLALTRHIGIEFVSRLFFYLLGCCPWDELRWWIFVFCHHIFSAIASQKRVRVRYCHKFVILKKLESFQFSIPRRPGRNLKLCGFVRRVKKLQNSGGNFGMGQLNSLLQASANGGRKLSYVRQRLVHQPRNKCLAFVLPIILNTWVIKDHCAYII